MSKVEIYTAKQCSFCGWAKRFFDKKGIDYEEIPVDTDADRRAEMLTRARMTSVPQIFINDTHVGGYEDLIEMDQDGKLGDLLGDV